MSYSRWLDVPELGQLYIEKVLVTFDVPELFVCKNWKGQRYLAVYEDDGDYRYLLAEIDCSLLHKMLQQELSIDQVFRRSLHNRAYRLKSSRSKTALLIDPVKTENLSQQELPDAGTYFSLHNKEIDAYRDEIENEYTREKFLALPEKHIGSVSVRYLVIHKEDVPITTVSVSGKKGKVIACGECRERGQFVVPSTPIFTSQGGSDEKKPAAVLKSNLNQADIFLKPSV